MLVLLRPTYCALARTGEKAMSDYLQTALGIALILGLCAITPLLGY
jgi:hypothetical protein